MESRWFLVVCMYLMLMVSNCSGKTLIFKNETHKKGIANYNNSKSFFLTCVFYVLKVTHFGPWTLNTQLNIFQFMSRKVYLL